MNLEAAIRPELWKAIQTSYEAGNYTHAIADAIHVLTDVIRDRSGLDGDGHQLVGQAFGGNSPRLKINKFQTESERNEQNGFMLLLQGLYRGIRNPRSHEHHHQIQDDKDTADKIIVFVDYMIDVLAESKPPFAIADFLDRVLDPHFPRTKRYAKLIVAEIPENRIFDAVTEVFRHRTEVVFDVLPLVFDAIYARMTDEQLDDYLRIVSNEMMAVSDIEDIAATLQMVNPSLWPKLSEMPRLRIETIMMDSISRGTASPGESVAGPEGFIGTWVSDHVKYFTQRAELNDVLVEVLWSDSVSRQRYVFNCFGKSLPHILEEGPDSNPMMLWAITSALCENPSNDSTRELLSHFEQLAAGYPDYWVEHIADVAAAANLPFDPIPF